MITKSAVYAACCGSPVTYGGFKTVSGQLIQAPQTNSVAVNSVAAQRCSDGTFAATGGELNLTSQP